VVLGTVPYYYDIRALLSNAIHDVFYESTNVGLPIGLGFALLGALWYGGFDVFQHFTLRLILIIQGYTPANYTRFLNYSVDHIFLQKVGGGYRFIHRLLLEHFADRAENRKV
jgi:hypothetical protein